jgi:hypothetical protein
LAHSQLAGQLTAFTSPSILHQLPPLTRERLNWALGPLGGFSGLRRLLVTISCGLLLSRGLFRVKRPSQGGEGPSQDQATSSGSGGLFRFSGLLRIRQPPQDQVVSSGSGGLLRVQLSSWGPAALQGSPGALVLQIYGCVLRLVPTLSSYVHCLYNLLRKQAGGA